MAFLLEEDEALKKLVTGITVSDNQRANRPVEVWFGQPDLELQQRSYPYISIELIDITEANERVMNGRPFLTYAPDGYTAPTGDNATQADVFPTPFDLDYQVTAWSRHPRHDRQMVAKLLTSKLPVRFGHIHLADTNRVVRLDMLDGPQVADTTDENGKRLFRKIFRVRIATELFLDGSLTTSGLIKRVVLTPSTQSEIDTGFEIIEAVIE